jgi:DNA (cytosine-5)-methyltransferase 1
VRLLDLFSCAGGAGMGYARAGFEVVGVDIAPQPHYPFEFVQADAVEYLREHGHEFDAIHASPPCQAFTLAQRIRDNDHPDLVEPTREALVELGKPWIIENVEGAPLIDPIRLCGTMFPGLRVYRHRLFESNVLLHEPEHGVHEAPLRKMGRPPIAGDFMHVVGNFSGVAYAREAMGIDWMVRDELREAIPPAFTEYLGRQLMHAVLNWDERAVRVPEPHVSGRKGSADADA